MRDLTEKILFSGISQKIEEEIKQHLGETSSIFEFCDFSETESVIAKFIPDILISAVSSAIPDYGSQVSQLKKISLASEIPFLLASRYSGLLATNHPTSSTSPQKVRGPLDCRI